MGEKYPELCQPLHRLREESLSASSRYVADELRRILSYRGSYGETFFSYADMLYMARLAETHDGIEIADVLTQNVPMIHSLPKGALTSGKIRHWMEIRHLPYVTIPYDIAHKIVEDIPQHSRDHYDPLKTLMSLFGAKGLTGGGHLTVYLHSAIEDKRFKHFVPLKPMARKDVKELIRHLTNGCHIVGRHGKIEIGFPESLIMIADRLGDQMIDLSNLELAFDDDDPEKAIWFQLRFG